MKTVQLSMGVFGIWGKTFEVTGDTKIQVEGRQATLEAIHEGAKVKASYETRAGKNFATRLEVMQEPLPSETPGQGGPKKVQ